MCLAAQKEHSMNLLTSVSLQGFKSIRELDQLSLGPLNVLIGANGAGKSNFISFFRLLNWMTFAPDQLQFYIGRVGGANDLLYDGAATTLQISAHLSIKTEKGTNEYQMSLSYAAPDTLIFAEEKFRYTRDGAPERIWTELGAGHREANLSLRAREGDQTARTILNLLKRCVVYQFHNTSETARIKQRWDVTDSLFLRDDGANLAAFLFRLREEQPKYYQRIVANIRQVAPFFIDFVLEPENNKIYLRWQERGTNLVFGVHQASDGTLRLMSLVTLLLQPKEFWPNLIIIDEPELGLHPYAIELLAGLLKGASLQTQIIVATQSPLLLNFFSPEEIIVVDRPGRESVFSHLDPQRLQAWRQEYSLAELWERNIIQGTPT
jgi:predicted ATPase